MKKVGAREPWGGGGQLKVVRRVASILAPVVALMIAGGANWRVG